MMLHSRKKKKRSKRDICFYKEMVFLIIQNYGPVYTMRFQSIGNKTAGKMLSLGSSSVYMDTMNIFTSNSHCFVI